MMVDQELLRAAESFAEELVEWRRDFHQHPELGFEERRTSQIVAAYLRQMGLDVRTEVGKTGVVGILRGEEAGPTVLLRADMDALPIPDRKTVGYASKHEGKAHLCGHDAHTTMLMGAVRLLAEKSRLRRGTVKFMFQPAEEGLAGAKAMIDDGVLDEPHVDAAFALHVHPSTPTGRIVVVKGMGWAAADRFLIRIVGRGGHAAAPHMTVDSVPIAAQVITALQHIASRQVDPLDSVVVTIGQIQGGFASNAIAPEVEMRGTYRTFNPSLRERMPKLIGDLVQGIAAAHGAVGEIEIQPGYPPVVNDERMVDIVTGACDLVLGEGNWKLVKPSMGAEDFAYVAERVPSAMFRLGTWSGEESTAYPLHHPMFDLDEKALPVGAALLSAAALHYLNLDRSEALG